MKVKFVFCVLAVLCIIAGKVGAAEVYIENHSFEEPNVGKIIGWDMDDGAMHVTQQNEPIEPAEVPGWESEGVVDDSGVGYGGTDGDFIGFLMGDDPTVWQLTDHTIGAAEVFILTFQGYNVYDGPEVTANLYYDDNGIKVVVASETLTGLIDDSTPITGTVMFKADDVPAAVGKKIGIEFDNPIPDINTAYGSWTGFDNVHLSVAVYHASLVYPADGATNVPLDVVLEWTIEEGYTCDVYFGTDKLYKVIEDSLATTYDPNGPEGLLDYDTTHYWRVDTIDPNDGYPFTQEGITWSFTSMSESVVILSGPDGVTIPAGSTAQISLEAISPSPIGYEWYKVKKGGGGDVLVSTDEILTIVDVQLEDEGFYYCRLTNDVGTVVSEQAMLMTARLVGWWKLDGDLTDSVASLVTGAPVHNGSGYSNFVEGIDGDAVDFSSTTQFIDIDGSEDYFNFYKQGMTVSAWIKTQTERWDGIISKHFRPSSGDPIGWIVGLNGSKYGALYGEYGAAHFTLRPYDDLFGNDYDEVMVDGQWYLVTAVMDSVTQTARIYINGTQKNESPVYDFDSLILNDEPVVFGAEDGDGSNPFDGLIDDVRLWSYPLSTGEIAELYLEFVEGEDICVNEFEDWLELDFVGEPGEPSFCKIDLEDIAEFLTAWTECNLVPTCLP
jgi:hypothetical protein